MIKRDAIVAVMSLIKSVLPVTGFLLLCLVSVLSPADETTLVDANGQKSPKIYNDLEALQIPNTGITVGVYAISREEDESGAIGFQINNKEFLQLMCLSAKTDKNGCYFSDIDGFGLYQDYIVLNAAMGATGRNTYMFLFKYTASEIELLDGLAEAKSLPFSFTSCYEPNDPLKPMENHWYKLQDLDGNGYPDINLCLFPPVATDVWVGFHIYFEIINHRLRVNLNPKLYYDLFKKELEFAKKYNYWDTYYIYGYLAGKFTKEQVRSALSNEKERAARVCEWLEVLPTLDDYFRNKIYPQRFVLKNIHLN